MATNKVIKTEKVQENLISGVNKAVNAIKKTLGPCGKCVGISAPMGEYPDITRDGATVAKAINLKDPVENMGATLVKKAASYTEELAGDGPQPLYAKVLTPSGWTTMGELKIGDKICGTNETVQEVIGIFHKGEKEIYKVSFSNGQEVECCEDHLWTITDNNNKVKTIPLKSIISEGLIYEKPCGQIQYKVYTPKTTVEFENKDLTLDPYLLGLLLGDGSLRKSGSIELSLGEKKIGVLDSIVLPDNIKYSSKYDSDKHYYRVKFSRIDGNGKTMHSYIDELGLLDSNSKTKFIPKNYLYSSKENREKLLLGLINTDGYLNSKGLIEYSTVSEQLCSDLVELMRGLGMIASYHIHTRENDDSYSNTPIYRINQLKGYKNGVKMIGIEKTGKFTEMQCIKVSNPDELYITNDYIVTHNTSTTSILIQEMVNRGQRYLTGTNVNEIKDGMQKAQKWVSEYIKANLTTKVDGDIDKIKKVATISANNDSKVGDLVAECMEKVGTDGVITVDMSYSLDTTVKISEGMKINKGYASSNFITEEKSNNCVLDNPNIIVTEEKITNMNQLIPVLEPLVRAGKPFVFFCDDIDQIVLQTLIFNVMRGACKCCVIKGVEFGDQRPQVMQDIAIATGATYICKEFGLTFEQATLEMAGSAEKIVIGKNETIIIKGAGDPEQIKGRVETLRSRMEDPECTKVDYKRFENRIASLTGGIGIIHAGGASEVERVNRKATIEDAVLASKSAIAEGVCEGGGYTFLLASEEGKKAFEKDKTLTEDEKVGAMIVLNSLRSILKTVCENAGVPGDEVITKLLTTKKGKGFNAKTKQYANLTDDGVLDSAKVLRVSLENAVSAASMILLTDCTITEEDDEDKGCCHCGK